MQTGKYFILIKKRKIVEWKIWKETAFIEVCSFFRWYLAFELVKLCLGVGNLLHFCDPETGVLYWKTVPRVGILMEKLVAQWLAPGGGGMVTVQIDTCSKS